MVERTSAEIKSFPAHKIGNATQPSRTIQVSCEFKNIYKGHTRADIAFTNTQYSRQLHKTYNGTKEACRQLLQTSKDVIILCPTSEITIKCYVDADFAGLKNIEDQSNEN